MVPILVDMEKAHLFLCEHLSFICGVHALHCIYQIAWLVILLEHIAVNVFSCCSYCTTCTCGDFVAMVKLKEISPVPTLLLSRTLDMQHFMGLTVFENML